MCGIVGYIGSRNAKDVILGGLKRLEYRGYDSAGIAILNHGKIELKRSVGKIERLIEKVRDKRVPGNIGIGHTRWATHGRPSEGNAHPHVEGSVAVVHNGIIENYLSLKEELMKGGARFKSETDTEILSHLIYREVKNGKGIEDAVREALKHVKGSYAIAVIDREEPDKIVGARMECPLVVGMGEKEAIISSDITAILDITRKAIFLEDGEIAVVTRDTIDLKRVRRICIIACGTSWHASLVGKFLIEELAGIPSEVDLASEFRYRSPIVGKDTLILAISQSGETADTLAAAKEVKKKGCQIMAICNVVESSLAMDAHWTLYTHAGPEIGVASTKTFTTQICALYMLAVYLGRRNGKIDRAGGAELIQELMKIPRKLEKMLSEENTIENIAKRYFHLRDFLYLGRGINYPIALEGALKLKEISYIHAEGYPAGEMKHGPIALIDEDMPVVALAPKDTLYEK